MDDWSSREFLSGCVTTDQLYKLKSYRAMNTYRIGDGARSSKVNDETGPFQNSNAAKQKRSSDPRFKSIINPQRETEGNSSKGRNSGVPNEREQDGAVKDKVISLIKPPKDILLYTKQSSKKFGDTPSNDPPDFTGWVTNDAECRPPARQSDEGGERPKKREVDLKDRKRIQRNIKTGLKKSASDCTFHVKNIYGDENEDLQIRPSGTHVASCTDPRKTNKPDKRRSVVTVIGQTQTKAPNELLEDINQRRKLAKELDRHALCKAILDSHETKQDVRNLVARINFYSPKGEIIYSTEKVYRCTSKIEDCGSCEVRRREDSEDRFKKSEDTIPERDLLVSQANKKSRPKRFSKKLMTSAKKEPQLQERIVQLNSKLVLAFFMVVLFLVSLFMYHDIVKPVHNYYCFDRFVRFFSPETTAWYDKFLF